MVSRGRVLVRFAVLCFVLAARATWAQADLETGSQAQTPSVQRSPAASRAQIDLEDPRVRERLRAAGIDPDDLKKLMAAEPPPPSGFPSTPMPGTATDFPPVTPPPGAAPPPPDSSVAAAPDSVSHELRPFGYEIFTLKPTSFEPLAFGPVSENYLLGPGDEILVNIWGGQEMSARSIINREGILVLPDIGQIPANGYTLAAFKKQLEKRLARIYSGISSDGKGRTFVDVSLGKLRSIQVFILGDVVQPGGYTLSATSTVMNALYFAGGPTAKGSLRNIRVMRGNQTIHHADLYEYLARGDRSQDQKLENGDVVFVPAQSRQVRLEGEVRHPAIYELREGERLSDLIELAGGLTATAHRNRIQVERVIPAADRRPLAAEDRRILDLALDGEGQTLELLDGDIVRVFRTRDILKNTVRVIGTAVYKPGNYEHRPGLTVADVIQQAGGLLGHAYTGWAHLIRTRPNKTRELRSFNLGAALARDPQSNLALEQLDEIQVFSIEEIRDPERVSIEGMVRFPGIYDLLDRMTVTDLVMKSGGLRESAYRLRAEVSRIDPGAVTEGKMAELIYVSLGDSMAMESEGSRFTLRKNDIVFVREIPNWSLQENVWVTGEVRFPGMYSLTSKTERLSSVIERAGGLEPTAYLQAGNFFRRKDSTGRMAIDFTEALRKKGRKASKYDLVLAAGDSIHVPREPKAVKVTGDVGFPSSVLWEKGRDMDYYIDQAGGLLSTADDGKITVVMANGRVERSGWMSSPEPDAGATIRVPRKPEEKDKDNLKTFAQIISILSGAATTIYLISQSSQ